LKLKGKIIKIGNILFFCGIILIGLIEYENLKIIRSDMSGVYAAYGCLGTFVVSGLIKSLTK